MKDFKKSAKLTCCVCFCLFLIMFLSCKKDMHEDSKNIAEHTADLMTMVTSSVSGFVTNQNDAAVAGALVKAGTGSVITDQYGYFEIKNVQVVKEAATVTVTYNGYFKGIKTYVATEGKTAFFRIKLLQKIIAGIIDASSGGSVSLNNGLNISFPANAVKDASTGALYDGMVNVAAQYIDPTSAELIKIMPGDLRGIDAGGFVKGLSSYGMAAIELSGGAGELLQIANGKKSVITMPVPLPVASNAPSSIPLWYFDETNGLWKEEGTAVKAGNMYVGEVSHFSFWNCDAPNYNIQFNCTVVNHDGVPLSYVPVKISVSNSNMAAWGFTDLSGFVAGTIPANAMLKLEVITSDNCNVPVYSQDFTTNTADVSLGNITLSSAVATSTVTGTVTDCNNMPVNNGVITMKNGNQFFRYALNNQGFFDFTVLLCNVSDTSMFVAKDIANEMESMPAGRLLIPGANAIGNLQACALNTAEFVSYTISTNGGPVIGDSLSSSIGYGYSPGSQYGIISLNPFDVITSQYIAQFGFQDDNIASGSMQILRSFKSRETASQTTIPTPVLVNITEYGNPNEYIAGNFSGTVIDNGPPGNTYYVTCTFRRVRPF